MVVLGTGRSHRAALDGELIAWGADFSRLEAHVADDATGVADGPAGTASHQSLEVVIARTPAGGGRKRVSVNGVGRRPAALAGALPVVTFAPEDMQLIVGSPAGRRQAIDNLVVQTEPAAASTMATYARAITQRNNLLRAIRDGSAGSDELRFWDEVLIDDGSRIVDWRRLAMNGLADLLADAHAEIAPDEGRLELAYLSNVTRNESETTRDALRRRLGETAEKEQWNGQTLVGPHRDDISFVIGARDLAAFASRGQQRTAILAFKLALLEVLRAEFGRPPLLLLDDVFSELDPARAERVSALLEERGQVIVTTADPDSLGRAERSVPIWTIRDGALIPPSTA